MAARPRRQLPGVVAALVVSLGWWAWSEEWRPRHTLIPPSGVLNLGEIPPPLAERKLTVADVLHIIGWHEAHHQGQAHITFNLYRAAHPSGA